VSAYVCPDLFAICTALQSAVLPTLVSADRTALCEPVESTKWTALSAAHTHAVQSASFTSICHSVITAVCSALEPPIESALVSAILETVSADFSTDPGTQYSALHAALRAAHESAHHDAHLSA
jgi:hypothetical protein